MIERMRALTGECGLYLDDAACAYIVAVIAQDLGLENQFPEITFPVDPLFSNNPEALRVEGQQFEPLAARLFGLADSADAYFGCLTNLHVRRVKYRRILRHQPKPSFNQVGHRGLLEYGTITPKAMIALLFWRKWVYDIDGRAAQETSYLFEPIIASAIGGTPASASKSPIRRRGDERKGRQVDCIRDREAYEFKMRVTIAASGQGRWNEELSFPEDCKASGYTPVLVVFDPTPNVKITELIGAFERAGGHAFIGQAAWDHLDAKAGPVMAQFLERYVRGPLDSLLAEVPATLPPLAFEDRGTEMIVSVGGDKLVIPRDPNQPPSDDEAPLPSDVDEQIPGP